MQALKKEGEAGQRTLTMYTRLGTVALAAFQAFGIAVALQKQHAAGGEALVYFQGSGFVLSAVVGLTAGAMFLMWLGEQMTERGVGNGISLLIFAGIVAGPAGRGGAHPDHVAQRRAVDPAHVHGDRGGAGRDRLRGVHGEGAAAITVNYARRGGGRQGYQNQSSLLPLKINMSGVIPPIFASSLLMFPATAANFWIGHGQQVALADNR